MPHFPEVRVTNRDGGWPGCGPALDQQRSCPTNRHGKHTSKRLNSRRLPQDPWNHDLLHDLVPGSFSFDSVRCLIARAKTWSPGYWNDGSGQKESKRDKIFPYSNNVGRGPTMSCNTSGQKVECLPTRYRFRQNTESLAHVIRGQCRRMARAFLSARL